MYKKELIKILEHARQLGISNPKEQTVLGRYYAAWKTETDEKTYHDLIQVLRKSKDLDCFDDKMFIIGNGAIRVNLDTLAKCLLYRTTVVGEEDAVSELEKFIHMKATPALNILLVSGIVVEKQVNLCKGICLVPFESIPDCLVKDMVKSTDTELKKTKWPLDMVPGVFLPNSPKTAIIKKVRIEPKSYDPKEKVNFKYNGDELYQVCDCLTLLGTSAPIAMAFCTVVEEWIPCSELLQGGWGSPYHDVLNVSMYSFTKKDYIDISNYVRQYFDLSEDIRKLLRISIQRLNLFRRRNNSIDKAIDLGIALESLLLHDRGPDDPISLPFRLRGAWLLGNNVVEREYYLKLFKDIYNCRCRAVHSGSFDKKFVKKLCLTVDETLKKGNELCVDIIKCILKKNKLPDWNKLVLGAF